MAASRNNQPKGLMRSLGEFVGHLWQAASKPVPPEPGSTHEHSRTVEEASIRTPTGPVTLRRTTIEEVVIDQPDAPSADPQQAEPGAEPDQPPPPGR